MKRFSKIFSIIVLVPSAKQHTAINCACISVETPDVLEYEYQQLFGRVVITARIQLWPGGNGRTHGFKFFEVLDKNSADVLSTKTSPRLSECACQIRACFDTICYHAAFTAMQALNALNNHCCCADTADFGTHGNQHTLQIYHQVQSHSFLSAWYPKQSVAAMMIFRYHRPHHIKAKKSQPIKRPPPAGARALNIAIFNFDSCTHGFLVPLGADPQVVSQ